MNQIDAVSDLAAAAAAQIVNLHLHEDPCTRFQAVQRVIEAALRIALMEARHTMLTPSEN
jgi:regulator of protease activity HflC (stomatin/prohibitin superfamily)